MKLLLQRLVDGRRRSFLLGLASQPAKLFLRLDQRLHGAVTGHDGFEHEIFWQLVSGRFDHQDSVARTGDGHVELGLVVHLAHRGVHDELAVDVAHLDGADGAVEGNAREVERGARADDAEDGGIVDLIG